MNMQNFLGYGWFLVASAANLVVFTLSLRLYVKSKRRMLVPLFVASALNALIPFVPWSLFGDGHGGSSLQGGIDIPTALSLVSLVLWTISVCLILRELAGVWAQPAHGQSRDGTLPSSEPKR